MKQSSRNAWKNGCTRWPKPCPVPYNTLTLALLGSAIGLCLYHFEQSLWWLSPLVFLLVLFWRVERAEYRREKRNYDSWMAEIGYLTGASTRNHWAKSMRSVKRRRQPSSPGSAPTGDWWEWASDLSTMPMTS